jgi:hypothetical protein
MSARGMSERQRRAEARAAAQRRGRRREWILLLLALPFLALLYVPFYAHVEPKLGGIPFFVWYQVAWIAGGLVLIYVVHRVRQ